MSNNLKKRMYTSMGLILLLTLMFFNIYILAYFLMIIGVFSILEFASMNKKIFKDEIYKSIFLDILFFSYIFFVLSAFFILSFFSHLKILIFIILLTCIASDIGGFIFGKLLKGPKLTKISPQKTISGSLGSIILSTVILSILIYYFTNSFEINIFIVGLITSITCQLGDLFFSLLKRKSKIKDTGNILPGHGGVLDRVDGILLGLPLGFIIMVIVY